MLPIRGEIIFFRLLLVVSISSLVGFLLAAAYSYYLALGWSEYIEKSNHDYKIFKAHCEQSKSRQQPPPRQSITLEQLEALPDEPKADTSLQSGKGKPEFDDLFKDQPSLPPLTSLRGQYLPIKDITPDIACSMAEMLSEPGFESYKARDTAKWEQKVYFELALAVPLAAICLFYTVRWILLGRLRPLWITPLKSRSKKETS